jgi:hypothetical protein
VPRHSPDDRRIDSSEHTEVASAGTVSKVAGLAVAAALALTAQAQASVYWVNQAAGIGRANLDGYELQPAFFRAVSQLLPPGAALTALRNAVYLGNAHIAGALVVLGAWAAAGAGALALGHHRGPLFVRSPA